MRTIELLINKRNVCIEDETLQTCVDLNFILTAVDHNERRYDFRTDKDEEIEEYIEEITLSVRPQNKGIIDFLYFHLSKTDALFFASSLLAMAKAMPNKENKIKLNLK